MVEHTFRVIKCQLRHRKARYLGLAKNTNQLMVTFTLLNLWTVRKQILKGHRYERVCSLGEGSNTRLIESKSIEIRRESNAGFSM